ncbi:MAG TPA: glycerol-3-phosphate dehydrogenase/oxidase [Longimicrobium sp.]|nr:glycerol-3-phosphate dehydrogenase/oxidase [Longimicrobium sp.]
MNDAPRFDLIIIGGGVNGTGIARDAAMRGLKVLMLEKRDVASGASGANSGMIHGGVRYLRYDRKVTALACIDSGYIQRIVPHLLFRIPFIYPLTAKDTKNPSALERAVAYGSEVYLGAYDLYQPHKRGKQSVRLTAEEVYELEPGIKRNLIGGLSIDEWGIDAWRLCTLNAQSAQRHGATVLTHTQVMGFLRGQGGAVEGVQVRDARTGRSASYRAKLVVNVAGAWAPKVASLAGVTVRMRPGKGVHLTIDRRLSNYGVFAHAVDGRQIFVMPHGDTSVIGTTDDDYYGDPDDLTVTEDEVKYLVEGIESAVPAIRQARIVRAWAGLRTTLFAYGKLEDDLSREHAIYDHAGEGAPGFLTLIGGKLASYRAQSQEFTDLAARRLGNEQSCRTHLEPLPGGERFPNTADLAREYALPETVVGRMAYRHGANAEQICELAAAQPAMRGLLCRCEQTTYAEAVYCLREENVRKLTDLQKRCRVTLGPCQGARCAGEAAALFARERNLSTPEAHRELRDLLQARFGERRPILDGVDLAQEELNRGNFLSTGNLDGSDRRG